MTPARNPWRRLSAGVAAAGVAAVISPFPAAAAPAPTAPAATATPAAAAGTPCARPERYAAETSAELLRLNRLDLRPTGRTDAPVRNVGLAAAASAMVAEASVNSAASARLLAGQPAGQVAPASMTRPLYQQAPPTNPQAGRTVVDAQDVGPVSTGAGRLTSHARWDAPMACGRGAGEVARAKASIRDVDILTGSGGDALIGVPGGLHSQSTTSLERRGANVHTVARSSVAAGEIRLLGGAVRVTVVRPPQLITSISANEGSAEVRYTPASLRVSGQGFATRRLDTPGDTIEVALPRTGERTESTTTVPGDPLGRLLASLAPGALRGLVADDPDAVTLPGLPDRPGIPVVPGDPESGEQDDPDTTDADQMVRITLGEVRQASAGHAVAARVRAVHVQLIAGRPVAGSPSGATGGVVLDMDLGVLEAAAVAPDPGTAGGAAAANGDAAGAGGGLPVTGSRVDLTLIAGAALLVAGGGFLWFGLRKHRRS
jgi:hypothetical protein